MGAELQVIDNVARARSEEIPTEVKDYLSHHLRNSLMGLLCVAYVNNSDMKLQEQIMSIVGHIEDDLGHLGL